MDEDEKPQISSEKEPPQENFGEAIDHARKSIFGDDAVSKALDDEMDRPPDDRSPLT